VVGTGTPASCTSAMVVAAVAQGGRITFRCGSKPVTIVLAVTAKVRNTSPLVVLDGGGLVTLSGGGKRRILYQDTCDPRQVWTTSHCDDQETPKLVLQNITFADGNATGQREEGGGGGSVLARGGQLRIVNSVFLRNRCDRTGPLRRQPGPARHPGRRQRRRDLQRRQHHDAEAGRHRGRAQHRRRGRRGDLLRQQRPHRLAQDPQLHAAGQPERRFRDGRLPRDLLPRQGHAGALRRVRSATMP
jgi:hypothetical protein